MAADEDHDVAGIGVGDRYTGVGEAANRRGNAGHDLERDALLVQEQRFLAAAVEHERIAPLQARDGLAFAGLLGDQVADGILVERPRRRRAHVDAFRLRSGHSQQARVDAVVVHDDVGGGEKAAAANADERRIPGPAPIR